MDKRITSMVKRTQGILRFYCQCGQMGIARKHESGEEWECSRCGEKRPVPEMSETILAVDPAEMEPASAETERNLDPQVKLLGEQLIEELRSENIGVGVAEIRGYFCFKLNLAEDLDEYLRMTSLEVEDDQYLLMSTSPGRLTVARKAVDLLGYGTQFAKMELSTEGDLALRWILPMANVKPELLKEVCLSMVYDTFMIRTTVLSTSAT